MRSQKMADAPEATMSCPDVQSREKTREGVQTCWAAELTTASTTTSVSGCTLLGLSDPWETQFFTPNDPWPIVSHHCKHVILLVLRLLLWEQSIRVSFRLTKWQYQFYTLPHSNTSQEAGNLEKQTALCPLASLVVADTLTSHSGTVNTSCITKAGCSSMG